MLSGWGSSDKGCVRLVWFQGSHSVLFSHLKHLKGMFNGHNYSLSKKERNTDVHTLAEEHSSLKKKPYVLLKIHQH